MVVLFLFIGSINGIAQTYTYDGSGDWHDLNNWLENGVNCNCVPTMDDNAEIPAGSVVEILAPAEIKELTISGEVTVSDEITSTNGLIEVSGGGALINDGSMIYNSSKLVILSSGSFTNNSLVNISDNSSGTSLFGYFSNSTTGTVTINNCYSPMTARIVNSGNITINNCDFGITIWGSSYNYGSGEINISSVTNTGIDIGSSASLINWGTINIADTKNGINSNSTSSSASTAFQNSGIVDIQNTTEKAIKLGGKRQFLNLGQLNIAGATDGIYSNSLLKKFLRRLN